MSVTCDSPDPSASMTRNAPSPNEPERNATRDPSGDQAPNGYPATVSVRSLRSEPSGRISDRRLSPSGSEWNTIHPRPDGAGLTASMRSTAGFPEAPRSRMSVPDTTRRGGRAPTEAPADHSRHTPDAGANVPARAPGSSEGVFEHLHGRPATDEGDARDVEADRLRPRPGAWRNASASELSLARFRQVTASYPPPNAAPRRDFTSQNTRTPPRSTTRSSSPSRHRQFRATIR